MNPELSPELKAMLSNCKKCKEYTRKEVVEEVRELVSKVIVTIESDVFINRKMSQQNETDEAIMKGVRMFEGRLLHKLNQLKK